MLGKTKKKKRLTKGDAEKEQNCWNTWLDDPRIWVD